MVRRRFCEALRAVTIERDALLRIQSSKAPNRMAIPPAIAGGRAGFGPLAGVTDRVFALPRRRRRGAAGGPAGKDAAAEERAF